MLSIILFSLMELPYKMTDLQPVISQSTLSYHHGKHLNAYVDNLNKLIKGSEYEKSSLEDIVKKADGAIFNNAGQVLNHNLYFSQFCKPKENNGPVATLASAIAKQFGSFETFKQQFIDKGTSLFGSGWVWLSCDKTGTLYITQEPNASNPIRNGRVPLLTMDVWEHAYYLDYQNQRLSYLNKLWDIIDWSVIENRYTSR